MIRRIIGIDFGTSTSVVCYKDYADGHQNGGSEPKHVEFEGSNSVPTLVFVTDKGQKFYGPRAKMKAESRPENLHANFKMGLAEPANSHSYKKSCSLMQDFFGYLYDAYMKQRFLPADTDVVESTYVSYPAKWPYPTREATLAAAERAGFPDVRGLEEPIAAMQFFFSFQTEQMRELMRRKVIASGKTITILLIDMGAGTTDLALYSYVCGRSEGHKVLCTWPPYERKETFGGHELDRRLGAFFAEFLGKNGCRFPERRMNYLIDKCKTWKEWDLSPTLGDAQTIDGEPSFCYQVLDAGERVSPFPKIDREWFERFTADYLPDFPRLINGITSDAIEKGRIIEPEAIDLILLTGGHSRWYFVKEAFCGNGISYTHSRHTNASISIPKVKKEPFRVLQDESPELTVARGLSLSGEPVRFQKVSNNSIWLSFALRNTSIPPIKVLGSGEILPFKDTIYRQADLEKSSFLDEFRRAGGSCLPMVGEDLQSAVQLEAISFEFDPVLVAKILAHLILLPLVPFVLGKRRYKADLLLKIEVDERERYSVVGLLKFGSHGPGIFAVNRDMLREEEKRKLIEEYDAIAQKKETAGDA
jgi:hypothetical protein